MSELNDKRMLRSLRGLSSVTPAADSTRAVMSRARQTLLRRRIMRWTLASGLAAALVALAVGLGLFTLTGTRATAAEALAQAAEKSKAYKGWVHERMGSPGDEKNWSVTHFNTETATWITEIHADGEVEIQMYVPADRTEVKYSSTDQTVRIGELYAGFAENWKKMIDGLPLTAAANIAAAPGAKVKESKEDGLTRFDVQFAPPASPKSPATTKSGDSAASVETETVIWADPQTKLVKKGRSKIDGESYEFSFTYGEPAIRDVYDLGVPRSAKVVDARPPKDVGELLERLAKRFQTGFGDYVAILTEQGVDEHGKPVDSGGGIWLLANNDKAYVANRYLVSDETKPEPGRNPKRKYGKVPAGWPTPELDAALASMAEVSPTNFLVSDGAAAWQGFETDPGSFYANDLNGPQGSQMVPTVTAQFSLPGRIWPTRIGMGAFGADAKLRVITDPAKPGMVALQVDQIYPGREMKPTRMLNTYWLNPAKDDMPVERTQMTYEGTTDREEIRFDTKYGPYAKTTNGKWYPTEWTTMTTMYQPKKSVYRQTERVRIWPGKMLEPRWFKRPEGKITTRQ